MSACPLDDEDDLDDLGLEPLAPRDMTPGDLADALDAVASGRRRFDASLLSEAAARLRTHLGIRAALLWRVEQVERLEAENARLRGDPTQDVIAVGR